MEQISRLLPSLSRFKDKPSDIEADAQSQESEARQPENRDQKTEESRLNPKPEEHKGIVNMAYSKTNGDDQEEKDMGIFKSFNNFTSRFKFMPDKIEDTKPPEANYGTFDSSPKKSDETTTNSYQSGINSNEANGVTEIPDKDQNSQRIIDEQTNEISEKKESTRATPEVPTIVTGSQPNSPQKKDETDGQTISRHARRNTDNVCFFEGATLSPDLDLRRRHSTDVISVPQPLNEELVLEDFKKRGSPFQRRSTKKKQIPDHSRRESYSPRMERKQKNSLTNSPVETRRKTLAELALESGYKPKSDVVDGSPKKDLTVNAEHDKVISASGRKSPSPIRISGEMYLTLEYCMETKAFIVHVHTANNIAVVDHKKQTSNPYVKTYLLPDKKSKRKTKTVRDNLNPQFDEVIKYPMSYDELLTRTLSLTVWHDDLFGRKDFLGEVVIPIGQFVEQGNSLENSIAKWYTLEEKVDHENDNKPEIILAVKYVSGDKVKRKPGNKKSLPSRGEMQLQILEAKNLPGKDADGMSDPFCKILLHPDKKGKTKHQTKKIDRTLNPVWNYKLSFEDLSIEDLYDRVLDITVWDHDMMSRDEFLGGVRLGTGEGRNEWDDSNDAEAQIWHTMLNRTNVWIQVVVPLRPNMEIRKAT